MTILALANSQVFNRQRLRAEDTCPEQGFFQDANNCQKFYRCAELPSEEGNIVNKYEFACPPGTIFDESISTCNHAYAVENVKPECTMQVEATLQEIRDRPDNEQYNQEHYVPEMTTMRPAKKNFNYNVYQTAVPQVHYMRPQSTPFVYQQPIHAPQTSLVYQPQQQQQVVYHQPQFQYQPQSVYTAGQPFVNVLGQQQGQVPLQYLKK